MWFNNVLIYKYELKEEVDFSLLFQEEVLKPCPPHARFIYGWLPVFQDELVQEVAGSRLFCLGKEERILPRGVIKRMLQEKVQKIEAELGKTIKRAEKAQMAEDLEFELLPKSFCVQKRLLAILDSQANHLIINAGSQNQASQLISLLRKTIPGLSIEPVTASENLALRFAEWINNPESLPENFELASDCLLFSLDDEKKRVNCKGYELPSEEILTLLSQGHAAAEISLVWNERIKFTLTQDLSFKRLKSLEYLIDEFSEIGQLEEEYQQRDAELTLLSGELRALCKDLFTALEKPVEIKEEEKELVEA